MGEDDIVCILPGVVSLCTELVYGFLMVPVCLTGCVCAEGSIAGHVTHVDCLVDCGLDCSAVHGFKPGEVLKLLGELCAQSLGFGG